MAKFEQPKFKYILSPENTYVIDFGDFVYEIRGSEIMNIVRAQAVIVMQALDKDQSGN